MISYKLLTANQKFLLNYQAFFAIVAKRAFFGLAIFKGVKTITKYSAAKKGPFDAISSSRFPRTRYPILCTMFKVIIQKSRDEVSLMEQDTVENVS